MCGVETSALCGGRGGSSEFLGRVVGQDQDAATLDHFEEYRDRYLHLYCSRPEELLQHLKGIQLPSIHPEERKDPATLQAFQQRNIPAALQGRKEFLFLMQ